MRKYEYFTASEDIEAGDMVVLKDDGTIGVPANVKKNREDIRQHILELQKQYAEQFEAEFARFLEERFK